MDPNKDSYSAFQAEDQNGSSLLDLLKILCIEEIYIAGLATDYCVKFSTHDAIKRGIRVNLLMDAIKGVNVRPDDSGRAIKEMVESGARPITLKELGEGAWKI